MITVELLKQHKACPEGIEKFQRAYPEGLDPTRENIINAIEEGFGPVIGWVTKLGFKLDLRGANLEGANLEGADLQGADLERGCEQR